MGVVVVPLLSEKEPDDSFILRLKSAESIFLLYVIDRDKTSTLPAGFMGSQIKSAEDYIEKIRSRLTTLSKTGMIDDSIEWGSWLENIETTARRAQAEKILMPKSELTERLQPLLEAKGFAVEVI
ncbi:MAG: hypothetical protein V1911_01725 [Candidatus Micrarchaeota archaeon]